MTGSKTSDAGAKALSMYATASRALRETQRNYVDDGMSKEEYLQRTAKYRREMDAAYEFLDNHGFKKEITKINQGEV